MRTRRYAVYWAPSATHPLWTAGCEWLGHDRACVERLPEEALHAATVEPRRYGFHATLKAPMRLASGVSTDRLFEAVHALAGTIAPFELPRLAVDRLDRFVALRPRVPIGATHPLRLFADRCVHGLDAQRAPLDDAELQARARGLDARGRELLVVHGYQYVLERWRFHMTLTDPIEDDDEARAAIEAATRHFAPALAAPLGVTSLAIFVQAEPGLPFVLVERVALGG